MGCKITILFAICVLVTACAPSQQTTQEPIKLGVALPTTGDWSTGGEPAQKGILLALDEINAQGGINGRKLELVVEDTHSKVPDAVTAVQKLINVDKVPAIIAGALSAEAVGVAPVAQQAHIVLLSPLALTSSVEQTGEWVFKLRESPRAHAEKTLAEMNKRGYKQIAVLNQKYEACDDLQNWMSKSYGKYGITVLAQESFEGAATDVRTQIAKLQQTNPDAWYVCALYSQTGLVLKQAKELGFQKQAFGIVAAESKKLFDVAGDAAEGLIFASTKFSCDQAKEFCAAYKQKYGAEPNDYRAAFGYDSLKLLAEAIKRKDATPLGIQQGLLSVQNYAGATGLTSFDADGNAQKEVVVKQVQNGTFVVIS